MSQNQGMPTPDEIAAAMAILARVQAAQQQPVAAANPATPEPIVVRPVPVTPEVLGQEVVAVQPSVAQSAPITTQPTQVIQRSNPPQSNAANVVNPPQAATPVVSTSPAPVVTATVPVQANTTPLAATNPAATVPSTPQPAPPKKHDPTVWRWYHSVTVGVIVFFLTIISVFLLGSSKVSDSNRVPEPTEKDIAQEKGKPSDDKEMAQQAIEKSRAARLSKDVARMRQALAGLKFLDDAKFRTSEFAPAFYERGMLHELIGNSAEARKDFSLIGKLK